MESADPNCPGFMATTIAGLKLRTEQLESQVEPLFRSAKRKAALFLRHFSKVALKKMHGRLERAVCGAAKYPSQIKGLFTDAPDLRDAEIVAPEQCIVVAGDLNWRMKKWIMSVKTNRPTSLRLNTRGSASAICSPSWAGQVSTRPIQAIRHAAVNCKVWGGSRIASEAAAPIDPDDLGHPVPKPPQLPRSYPYHHSETLARSVCCWPAGRR